MKIGIVMGSDSDLAVMKKAAAVLDEFGLDYEMVIASAHRTPAEVKAFVERLEAEGAVAFVAGAGAAAHLPGVIASFTTLPVIGVPLNATALKGMDALLVATMAVDGAKNAALLAVQIAATADAKLRDAYKAYRADMAAKVIEKNKKLQEELAK